MRKSRLETFDDHDDIGCRNECNAQRMFVLESMICRQDIDDYERQS